MPQAHTTHAQVEERTDDWCDKPPEPEKGTTWDDAIADLCKFLLAQTLRERQLKWVNTEVQAFFEVTLTST